MSAGGTGGVGSADDGCPASPPEVGSECEVPWMSNGTVGFPAAHCSWGEDPRPACRTTAVCTDETWTVLEPTDARCETEPLSESCPQAPPTVGEECPDVTSDCWYAQGAHCFCSPCQGGSEYPICSPIDPPEWACVNAPAECPTVIPQASSACDEEGLSCGPNCELEVTCDGSVWQWNQGSCPICAAPTTLIATPSGEREIASLRVGDWVYSVNDGAIEAVKIVALGSTPVTQHSVVRVTLKGGAVLEISPGHPTADGRLFGELGRGDLLDGTEIDDAGLVPYVYDRTYDILPGSDTGTYFASGALIGSTLGGRLSSTVRAEGAREIAR
jgi:hypothetical protein